MGDIAEIGFKADSKDLVTAKRDLDALTPAAKRAEQAADNLSTELKKTNGTFGDLASGSQATARSFNLLKIASGVVVGAIAAIAAAAKGSYSEMVQLESVAKRTGAAFDGLQKSRFAAASLGGLGGDDFYKGVDDLGKEANKNFREGEGKLKELFEANNLSITDRAGKLKDVNALLLDASTLIQNANTEFDKLDIAKILGLSKEWVDALENGPDAFKNAGMEATKSGAIIDSELVKRAAEFDKAWSQSSETFSIKMKAAVAGIVIEMLNLITLIKGAFAEMGKLSNNVSQRGADAGKNIQERIAEKQRQRLENLPESVKQRMRENSKLEEIAFANSQTGWNPVNEPFPPSRPDGLRTPRTTIPNKSGGGSSKDTEKELSDLQKIAEAYKALSEPFNQANSAFTAAKSALENGLITNEAYAQSLIKIKDAFMAAGGTSDQWAKLVAKNTDDVSDKMEKFAEKSLKKVGDEFVDMAFKGKISFGDLAKSIVKDLVKIMVQALIVKPLMGLFGSFSFDGIFGGGSGSTGTGGLYAKGDVFGKPHMFAGGGSFTNSIVNKPTPFNFAGGSLGVMGEDGPEAIVPLSRGADGSLGVQMHGGAAQSRQVENNVSVTNQFTISGAVSSKDIEMSIRSTAEKTTEDVKKQLVGWIDQYGRDGYL